jgi:predicted house-cleaning noncanonical NTP pyrophosphatase (MazG superfamily)
MPHIEINKSNYKENKSENDFKKKFIGVQDLIFYEKIDYKGQLKKVEEEFEEVVKHTSKENLAEEIGDLIQAAYGLSIVAKIELEVLQSLLDKKRIERGDIK